MGMPGAHPARIGLPIAIAVALAASAAQPDVADLVQRSKQAVQADWKRLPGYDDFERDVEDHSIKTYHTWMIDGSPYNELVAVNDQPLPQDQQREEQQKTAQVRASRDSEAAEARKHRMADYVRGRDRDHELAEQLVLAFDFKYMGETMIGPYKTYILRATPKPGYRPPDKRSRVLTGMRGTMWIDETSCEWVKVEAEVIHPVSIDGFLARVETGTRFELEKRPIAPGIWFPSHFSVHANAKILDVFGHSVHSDETYYDYRKIPNG